MKRNTIALLIAITVLLVAAGFGLNYYFSFKKVTITTAKSDLTADVFEAGLQPEDGVTNTDVKVGSITGPTTLSLKPGSYYIIPTTKNYDTSPITFTISDKDVQVSANPGYSADYLASLLPDQLNDIKKTLLDTYPILRDYAINDGKLYIDGTWYGTTLIQPQPGPGALGDVYRVILHQEGGEWKVKTIPQIVLTAPQNPDVPKAVLSDLNKQSGYEE